MGGFGELMSSEMAEDLSKQTRDLLSTFEARVSSFSRRQDLVSLTRQVRKQEAETFAREFFGEGEHLATGIDGFDGLRRKAPDDALLRERDGL